MKNNLKLVQIKYIEYDTYRDLTDSEQYMLGKYGTCGAIRAKY